MLSSNIRLFSPGRHTNRDALNPPHRTQEHFICLLRAFGEKALEDGDC
jgi:hypothetical protein